MNDAIIKDVEKNYVEAIKSYENEITNGHPNIDHFTNLSFLYWSFAAEQIEFNDLNNITDELSLIGGEKFIPTIERGLKNYPDSLELNFWRRYLPYRLYMCEFSENDCKYLLEEYKEDSSLVPYFFLSLFDKESYLKQTTELKIVCDLQPTAKNNYINSFLS